MQTRGARNQLASHSSGKEIKMNASLRNWLRSRRYRATLRALRATPAGELRALGIPPREIDRLACAAVG